MQERLQKIISRAGVASRRKAEELMTAGKVEVNGKVVKELGTKADAALDSIRVSGKELPKATKPVVYMLNKPLDVVSTNDDPDGRQTVLDFVPPNPRVFPVGRLDRMTEGLILLTNDGDLALRLSHPRYEHEKEYEVTGVTKMPVAALVDQLRAGVTISDGPAKPDHVELKGIRKNRVIVSITVHEGRTHLIRRMCGAIDFEIQKLVRTRVGRLELGDLAVGKNRRLSDDEIALLTQAKV